MKLLRPGCLLFVLFIAAFVALVASLQIPHAGFQGEVFVDIARGTGTRAMAAELREKGVIRYEWQLLMARALRPSARLKAGEYRFAKEASTWEVFDRLARGDVFYYEFTVPEGRNIFDIADLLAELKLAPAGQFPTAARDPASIRDLAPRARTLEGFLFPSTYRITKHTTAEQICKQMTDQFRKVWKDLGVPAATDVAATVALASLVEKETAVPRERPLVASVYANRLRIGMKLDCDPTVIYAALLAGRYRGTLYKSDLERDSPYNTYRVPGPPPGPITNPGRAALEAALRPAETAFLYFVAKPDGSGEHQFSKEYGTHAQVVGQYRRGKK